MPVFINPFTDFGFKRIFGQESSKRILIGFLNALFEGEFVVVNLEYRDKEQPGQTKEERGVIFDIYCTASDGRHFIVEMQNKNQVNFEARALYYMSRSIVAQGEKGDDWQYEYCPVIGVFLMNFKHKTLGEVFRSDYGVRNIKIDGKPEERKTPPELAEKMRMVFLQMPLFNKTESECVTKLDKWTYLVKNMEKLKEIPWKAQDEVLAELEKVSNVAALSPEERHIYEVNLRVYRDNLAVLEASYQDGHESGFNEGLDEAKEKFALSLLKDGAELSFIAKHTGLSLDDVQRLKNDERMHENQ